MYFPKSLRVHGWSADLDRRQATSLPWVLAFGSAVAMAGCFAAGADVRGYPLYSAAEGRLPSSRVAKLSASLPGGASPGVGAAAFIKTVDGREVSTLDTAFELLPGCHIVQTQSRLLVTNEVMSWSGELGSRTFPFRMKPGHTYTVVVELAERFGGTARVSVYGIEQDSSGRTTQTIPPATQAEQVRACQAWAPPEPAEPTPE